MLTNGCSCSAGRMTGRRRVRTEGEVSNYPVIGMAETSVRLGTAAVTGAARNGKTSRLLPSTERILSVRTRRVKQMRRLSLLVMLVPFLVLARSAARSRIPSRSPSRPAAFARPVPRPASRCSSSRPGRGPFQLAGRVLHAVAVGRGHLRWLFGGRRGIFSGDLRAERGFLPGTHQFRVDHAAAFCQHRAGSADVHLALQYRGKLLWSRLRHGRVPRRRRRTLRTVGCRIRVPIQSPGVRGDSRTSPGVAAGQRAGGPCTSCPQTCEPLEPGSGPAYRSATRNAAQQAIRAHGGCSVAPAE